MKQIPVYYDSGYAAPIGDAHIMPMRKFALVAEEVRKRPTASFRSHAPATREMILQAHTSDYVTAVETGEPRPLAESQKFPWSPALYPSVLLTNGGVTAAAREALANGTVAACIASGFHHSGPERGQGFCTFNGLIVALETLRAEGLLQHAAILDMDLHYGNGTAALAASRPWIKAVSIYGNDYWDNVAYKDVSVVHHTDGSNHIGIPVANGTAGPAYLDILEKSLPLLIAGGKPDLLLYQAGADPYREDPYSPLDLGHDDLKARDRRVFEFCRQHRIPVAWVLAGGYTKDTSKVVQVHVNTFDACAEVFLHD